MRKSEQFEQSVREFLSQKWKIPLKKGTLPGVPKEFDMISLDGKIVGDAKYYTMVRGVALPPAKFATIAEYVWLMEKTKAEKKFLVFGNSREVPNKWLEKYQSLLHENIAFYFFDEIEAKLEKYNMNSNQWEDVK